MVIESKRQESSYHGNPNLKPIGYQYEYSKEELDEYAKCASDIEYFIEHYCKIISLDHGLVPFILHDYQKEAIDLIHNNRKVILMQSRQSGKTILSAAYILHYT
jgi:superfamily II RNA helicase